VSTEQRQRVRLRLPDGAEFEAEGSPEFIRAERQEFLSSLAPIERHSAQQTRPQPKADVQEPSIPWEAITERKGHNIHLRAKLPGEKQQKDACLVLLAASQKLLQQPKPTAAQLAKWLRTSGYPIQRMDRALQEAVAQGEILSSGSRRARRYELTSPGRLKAFILAEQLALSIDGHKYPS